MYMKTRRISRFALPMGSVFDVVTNAWDSTQNPPVNPAPVTLDAGPATVTSSDPAEIDMTGSATHSDMRSGASSGGGFFGGATSSSPSTASPPGAPSGVMGAFKSLSSIEKVAIVGALGGVAILALTGPKPKRRRS